MPEQIETDTTNRVIEPLSVSCLPGTALRIGQQPAALQLIESRNIYTIAGIRSLTGAPFSIVCDFRVQDIESGTIRPWGFEKEGVLAIDHHMPAKEMERLVSSTNLALQYVEANGPAGTDTPVLINHTDCDSILSSAIIRGVLPPLQLFGEAALKADHLGVSYDRHEVDGKTFFQSMHPL